MTRINPIYIAYFDEFGHVGPFVNRADSRYMTSPVFGLGGFIMPAENSRAFSAWFHWFKKTIFSREIKQSGIESFHWEKKGNKLFQTHGNLKYRGSNQRIFQMVIKNIQRFGGFVIYTGMLKYKSPDSHNSKNLYMSVVTELHKRVHHFCEKRSSKSIIVLDQCGGDDFRTTTVDTSALSIFGTTKYHSIIEPIFQAESHLYQNLQCADWICAVISRIQAYEYDPVQYKELEWIRKYGYDQIIKKASLNSGIKPVPKRKNP
ncbi:MAG: DUF3800 domain-containing protein [Synergistaceae bacterium]|jgi:hypothetical protein|nr:DUF3800 domain-containing protein [Synergistaceae bacterium]